VCVPLEHKQLDTFRSDLELLYFDLRGGVCVVESRVVAERLGGIFVTAPGGKMGGKINILIEVFELLCPKFKLLSQIEGN